MANCAQCGRKLPSFSFKKICAWCVQHEAEQRGEVAEDARQRVMLAPWVRRESGISLTQVIFGANAAVFLGMVLASGDPASFANPLQEFPVPLMVHWGANVGVYTFTGEWWRLLTYMFLHGGLLHIAFNMWCLWDLGQLCETLYGRWTYFCIYLITGVAAGLASAGWHPGAPSVGASGAIFGLAGALVASFALGEFSMPSMAIRSVLKSLLFFIGFNVLFGGIISGTDNAAHIGGLVSGLVLGALIARVAPDHDNLPRRVGVLLFAFALLAGCGWKVWQWRAPQIHALLREADAGTHAERIVNELQQKVSESPDDASAHYALAHAYFVKQQFPEGEKELEKVLQLQPENLQARMLLANILLAQGQAQAASEHFKKLIEQDPDNAKAHTGLGISLAASHQDAAAIEEFQAAVKIDPEYGKAYYPMGISYANLKKYDDAISAFLNARLRNGDDAQVETALADVYQAKGMTNDAEMARKRADQLRGPTE